MFTYIAWLLLIANYPSRCSFASHGQNVHNYEFNEDSSGQKEPS